MGHARTAASVGGCGGDYRRQDDALGEQLAEVGRDGNREAVRSLLELWCLMPGVPMPAGIRSLSALDRWHLRSATISQATSKLAAACTGGER